MVVGVEQSARGRRGCGGDDVTAELKELGRWRCPWLAAGGRERREQRR